QANASHPIPRQDSELRSRQFPFHAASIGLSPLRLRSSETALVEVLLWRQESPPQPKRSAQSHVPRAQSPSACTTNSPESRGSAMRPTRPELPTSGRARPIESLPANRLRHRNARIARRSRREQFARLCESKKKICPNP